jgi:hypothetical protein
MISGIAIFSIIIIIFLFSIAIHFTHSAFAQLAGKALVGKVIGGSKAGNITTTASTGNATNATSSADNITSSSSS